MEHYTSHGHKAICTPFAIDEDYYNYKQTDKYNYLDAIFVGNNYNYYDARHKAYLDVIQPFIDENKKIEVYGNNEWVNRDYNFNIEPQYYKGYMSHEETPYIFSSAKIILGVHSVVNSLTMQSMRTFEVLGCRGFFLSSYTKSVENMFENHVHLTYSSSPEETKEIMDFYLNNEDARNKIALAGQKLVYEKHTYKQRVNEIINALGKGE
ncbi:Spore protein YkvP [compost metagenome]